MAPDLKAKSLILNKILEQNLFKILITVPAIFTVVGTIIININLRRYGIEDFYILSLKNLIVGGMFFTTHLAFFCTYTTFLNTKKFYLFFLNALTKPFFFVAGIALLLPSSVISLTKQIQIGSSFLICFAVLLCFHKDEEKISKIFKSLILAVYLPLMLANVIFASFNSPDFRRILYYFLFTSVFLSIMILKQKELFKTASRNLVFITTATTAILFFTIFSYSKFVYPCLTWVVGGANYEDEIIYFLKDSTSRQGKVLHSNQNSIFLKSDDSMILEVHSNEIESRKIITKIK
jgi:hypothetical protein